MTIGIFLSLLQQFDIFVWITFLSLVVLPCQPKIYLVIILFKKEDYELRIMLC